jgi:hypothetical protein
MSASSPVPWSEFSHDPRRPESAGLRASDRDRDVVLRVLGDGFADGRLDRTEYDERAEAVTRARTFGELQPIIADLVPSAPSSARSELAVAGPETLREMAVREYGRDLRNAASSVVVLAAISTAIWILAGGGYYWPAWVILFPAVNLLRLLVNKGGHVDDEMRRLEKKQRKEIERAQRPEIEGHDSETDDRDSE